MKRTLAFFLALMFVFCSFSAIAAPAENKSPDTVLSTGDVNGNGEIDSLDYILVKRAYFHTFALDDVQAKCADVNFSGGLDSMDYILIKRVYFGTYAFPEAPIEDSDETSVLPGDDAIGESSTPMDDDITDETNSAPGEVSEEGADDESDFGTDNVPEASEKPEDESMTDTEEATPDEIAPTVSENNEENVDDSSEEVPEEPSKEESEDSSDNSSEDSSEEASEEIDEIPDETSEDSSEDVSQEVSYEESEEESDTENDILLCYIAEAYKDISITKETFLPAAGYYVDGKVEDYMFDSFIFLCQPNYLYSWDSQGVAYLNPFDKYDWQDYITNYEFKYNRNINALDQAVGEIKTALGDTEYKAKVYMTLFYPVEDVYFGEVNGEYLILSDLESRNKAMEWMVDESIRQFNAQNYQNIELAGFYWFCEEIYESGGAGKKIAKHTTDYIREQGLKTCWCPYFWAEGYDEWQEMGFDIATQQANYFPAHRTDWPNKGGAERLPLVAKDWKKYGIGVGMEMADTEVASAEVFKEYMKAGVEYGFMNANHIYYMSTGPSTLYTLCNSYNQTLRTTYDELYKYINRTLTVEDITN